LTGLTCSDFASATSEWCAVPEMTPDGFLNLRDGPGIQSRIIGRVVPSDYLFVAIPSCQEREDQPPVCDETRRWEYIEEVFSVPEGGGNGWINWREISHHKRGWVRRSYLRRVACAEHLGD
jgi:hypothetical protein